MRITCTRRGITTPFASRVSPPLPSPPPASSSSLYFPGRSTRRSELGNLWNGLRRSRTRVSAQKRVGCSPRCLSRRRQRGFPDGLLQEFVSLHARDRCHMPMLTCRTIRVDAVNKILPVKRLATQVNTMIRRFPNRN